MSSGYIGRERTSSAAFSTGNMPGAGDRVSSNASAKASPSCEVVKGVIVRVKAPPRRVDGSRFGILPTVAWQQQGEAPHFALEGGVYNAASAVNWAKRSSASVATRRACAEST